MSIRSIEDYGGECSEPIDFGPHRTGASRRAHSQGRGSPSRPTPVQQVIRVPAESKAAPAAERIELGQSAAEQAGGARRSPGRSRPTAGADRARSEPLTALGRRLLQGLLGAGSGDSFHSVRMPSGSVVVVEDPREPR